MRHGRAAHQAMVVMAAIVSLLASPGCSADGGQDDRAAQEDGGVQPAPEPASTAPAPLDPERMPADFREALDFARAVSAEPTDYGTGFVRQEPYESDPTTWAVLNDDCVWRREPLPGRVLANLTRNVELPAAEPGAGSLRVMSSVTVFDSTESADERMAGILEEVLHCPEQRLRDDERVSGLGSGPAGDRGEADDEIDESGEFRSAAHGGPHPYRWLVSRVGPVVIALSVKGTEGYTADDLLELSAAPLSRMRTLADEALR